MAARPIKESHVVETEILDQGRSVKADEDDELVDSTNVFSAQYSRSSKPRFFSYFENFGLDNLFPLGEIINNSAVWRRISSFESNTTH